MNTTFTAYAAKAKQFLNLLQGYTKGIRFTAILILLLMGVSNAWAARTFKSGEKIYFKDAKDKNLNNSTWKVGDGNIYAYFWNNSDNAWSSYGNLVSGSWNAENAIYEFTVPGSEKTYTKMLFTRGTAANWNNTWNQTGDQTPNDGQNIFYISSGTWGAYAKNGAIVGTMNNWNPDTNPLSSNKVTISLNYTSATSYDFKVLYGETYYGTTNAISGTVSNQVFSTSGNNCTLNLVVASTAQNYTFTWDNTNKKLSVTYPTSHTVTYSQTPAAAANVPTTSPSVTSSKKVASGTSVTFTAQTANTGYTWKGWYSNNAGTSDALTTNLAYEKSITANTTIYAVYTANTYNITYKDQGNVAFSGTHAAGAPTKHTYGTATTLSTASKDGYTFGGWFTTQDCSGSAVTTLGATAYTAAITLYAKWTANTYTVTFNANGHGTAPDAQTINHGSKATEPTPAPQEIGYTFGGWYTEANCTNAFDFNTAITADITLYAKWEERKLFINTNWIGGWYWSEEMTHKTNTTYTYTKIAMQASKDQYFFRFLDALGGNLAYGWDDLKEVTTTNSDIVQNIESRNDNGYINFNLTRKSDVTITLTLQSANDNPKPTVQIDANPYYTITWMDENDTIVKQELHAGETITPPADPSREGYTFAGWSPEVPNTMPAEDVTYTAQWTLAEYTINYKNQDGSDFSGTHADGAPTTHTYGTETTLKSASKAGYTFGGWHTDAACTNEVTSLGATDYTADITLYAKWEARELFLNASWIIWDDKSYTARMTQDGDNPAIFTYKHTAPAEQRTEDTNPRYHNFRFVHEGGALAYGWKEVDEEVTTNNNSIVTNISNDGGWDNIIFSLTHKSDITITLTLQSDDDSTKPTVRIDATPYYEITLDQTGCAQPGTTTTEVKWGSDMPIIELPVAPIGYTFGGYYTEKNGGGTQYYNENGGSAKAWNIAANTTLYAKWTAIKYNITYTNLGGATHTNAQTYTIEDAITFSKPSVRNGYTFAGWYPASIEKGSTGDKTITAQWTEKPGTTVYLKANDMWKSDGAKLAVYAWNNTENTWLDVEYDDCTGNLLMAEIPAKYNTGIKFVRLNPNPTSDDTRQNNGYNFANAWNQTSDLKIPADNNNLYDLTKYIYLKPNDNWKEASARFAAYFYKSSGSEKKWEDMTDADGDGYYSCEKPDGCDWVIFCRMDPATSANDWNNRWNQSANQGIPENNLFTVNDGQWGGKGEDNNKDGATGHWDNNHWDNSQWTTYTASTFAVTISEATNGTIKVAYNGQTYTSGQTISNVPIHTELNVTFIPATGYVLTNPQVTYADQIAEGVYSICGPSVISAAFTPRGETRVIYLRPNDDWLHNDAIFVAHAWNSDGNSDYVLTTKDNDYTGSYSCTIDSKYDHILFARLDPADKGNIDLAHAWNKTKDLEIVESIYTTNNQTRFAIGDKVGGEGEDKDLYNGEWETNSPIWGITADFNNWNAERFVFKGYPGKMDVQLSRGNYQFKLYNFRHDHYYGNSSTYRRSNDGEWWTMDFHSSGGDNCTVTADVDNEVYLFQLQLVTETGTYKKQISITYPNLPAQGDYRLAYHDNAHPFHPGHLLKQREGEDTVSFFVHYNNDPVIMLQQVTAIDPTTGAITWETRKTYALTANQPGNDHPGQAMMPGRRNAGADEVILHIGGEHLENVDATGVYNFILEQTADEATLQKSATKYDGNFYIRTNAAAGGWGEFREAGNKMTYSSYADSHSDFNHYFVEWIEASTGNVEFTIANDYSYCISDTLVGDAIVDNGWLPANANVRFGWDSRNNKLTRAYIAGSGNVWDRFLVVTGNDLLKDASGNVISAGPLEVNDETKEHPRCNLKAHEVIFTDLGNWVYQVDVTAQNRTKINLTALYNGTIQYFKGAEGDPSYSLLASTNSGKEYKIRMIYNFKSNHLVVAWLPDSPYNANGDEHLGTDMLLIRRNQDPATQLKLNSIEEKDTISGINTAYAVMTFTKTFVEDDKKPIHERKHYWVSFPFDVKISDVFGFSEYKDHWIMQAYDGAGRAANGLWADTDTYWKYITNANYVMRKGQGYVLTLDVKKMLELDPVFANTGEVSLYFPSRGKLDTITSYVPTAATVPAHTCTIERENRKIYDSHWNMIGVPGFADIEGFNTDKPDDYLSELGYEGGSLNFYYQYIPSANSYQVVTAETTFQSMYSYMVQFAGTINWRSRVVAYNGQQQLAARRNSDYAEPEKVSFRLELAQGDKMADQTFVQLQEEGATHEFDMNLDLTKIINSGANIYTLAGESRIQSAGNALPMGEAVVVPVGVKIDAEGEYTFRMPDGTEGMVVELVDYETNNRTNLLLTDYTVTLPKGTSENRFALHIQPQKDVVTSLENIGEGVNNGEAVNKYLIDGKLIIRTAEGIFDAQGHRL